MNDLRYAAILVAVMSVGTIFLLFCLFWYLRRRYPHILVT